MQTQNMGTQNLPSVDRRAALKRMLPGIAVSIVVPFVVYESVRSSVDSDTTAFAIGAAVPVLWTVGSLAVRRRIDPLGVFGTVVYGLALLVTWLTGGGPLFLELRDAVPTGLIGLAFLVSVAVRRPLIVVLMRYFGRWNAGLAGRARQLAPVAGPMTALVGALLLLHSAVMVTLALSVSTATFAGVSQPVSWAVLAAGAALVIWYRKKHAVDLRKSHDFAG